MGKGSGEVRLKGENSKDSAMKAMEEFGGVDISVQNAGIITIATVE